MGEHDIDKLFKGLNGYSEEVDTDAIWKNLDLEKKKRRTIIFLLFGFFLVIGMSVWFFGNTEYVSNKAMSSNTEISQPSKREDRKSEAITSTYNAKERDITLKESKPPQLDQLENKTVVAEKLSENMLEESRPMRLISKNEISNSSKVSNSATLKNDASVNQAINGQRTITDQVNLKQLPKPVGETSTRIDSEKVKRLGKNKRINSIASKLDLLSISKYYLLEIPERILSIPNSNYLLDSEEKVNLPKPRNLNRMSMDFYTGYYLYDRTINKLGPEGEKLLTLKNETESPLEIISAGAQVKYDLDAVFIKSGVELQSINEKFAYETTEVVDTVATIGVASLNINISNDTSYVDGPRQEVNTLTSRWQNYNNHQLVTIPVSIGIEKSIKRISISAEATTFVNIYHRFSGKHLQEDEKVTSTSEGINTDFKLGFGISADINYAISSKTKIYLAPQYFFYSDSFLREATGLSQKYKFYGLRFGISYNLKNTK